ncbi:hypothetical protein [Mesorhizobium sp. M1143]|uniref:hypothetical protein n=1 Tax=Mesorhizobium sp. M1143 TaxID=2957061 RepID=UPI00333D49CE
MTGWIVPCFLCLALLASSGCARSYDGTVVIPRPLDIRRVWDRDPSQTEANQMQAAAGVFPSPPQESYRPAARRHTTIAAPRRHVRSSPPSMASEPANPLTCKNVSEPGKRYRMVCQ